jgi:hypothetical protein
MVTKATVEQAMTEQKSWIELKRLKPSMARQTLVELREGDCVIPLILHRGRCKTFSVVLENDAPKKSLKVHHLNGVSVMPYGRVERVSLTV